MQEEIPRETNMGIPKCCKPALIWCQGSSMKILQNVDIRKKLNRLGGNDLLSSFKIQHTIMFEDTTLSVPITILPKNLGNRDSYSKFSQCAFPVSTLNNGGLVSRRAFCP